MEGDRQTSYQCDIDLNNMASLITICNLLFYHNIKMTALSVYSKQLHPRKKIAD